MQGPFEKLGHCVPFSFVLKFFKELLFKLIFAVPFRHIYDKGNKSPSYDFVPLTSQLVPKNKVKVHGTFTESF